MDRTKCPYCDHPLVGTTERDVFAKANDIDLIKGGGRTKPCEFLHRQNNGARGCAALYYRVKSGEHPDYRGRGEQRVVAFQVGGIPITPAQKRRIEEIDNFIAAL